MRERPFGKMILMLMGGLLLATSARAQARYVLHVSLLKSGSYVAGSSLTASGLYRLAADSTWTHIGWNNPRVIGLGYDPTDPDVVFLACGNGALRTLDGGKTWRITTDWRVTDALSVAVDPNEPSHVYLGTAYGVWVTADRGDTWKEVTADLTQTYTRAVAVDGAQAGRVFAGMEGGLFVSEDRGASWTQVAPYEDVMALQQSATDPQRWLAGTQNDGILSSRDGGRTWQQAAQDSVRTASIYSVAIDPLDASRMAAVGWDTGVLVSTDGGRTWQRRGRQLPSPRFYKVVFDPNVPGRIWAATVEAGIFYSDDLGRMWQPAGMDGIMVFDMIFIGSRS